MNSRLNSTEECISDLEDGIKEATQAEQQIDKWKKKQQMVSVE